MQHVNQLICHSHDMKQTEVKHLDYIDRIRSISPDEFIYKKHKQNEIYKIKVGYSEFTQILMFQEEDSNLELVEFDVDYDGKLYVLSWIKGRSLIYGEYFVKVFNTMTNKAETSIKISDPDFIGQLISGNFSI